MVFQSTPSARRATASIRPKAGRLPNFNPRPPRGGRPGHSSHSRPASDFNPRPPRGGRRKPVMVLAVKGEFQSTPSARRATLHPALEACFIAISIHALREEDDRKSSPGKAGHRNFNPRPPRGERPAVESLPEPDGTISIHALRGESDVFKRSGSLSRRQFQSTPSARRATKPVLRAARVAVISIHALRGESDIKDLLGEEIGAYFNPRSPWGERLF